MPAAAGTAVAGRHEWRRRPAGDAGCAGSHRGATLLELMFVISLGITVSAIAVPSMLGALHAGRAEAAARHLAGRLRLAQMEAIKRSRNVALRFERHAGGYRYVFYLDGNGNGVRTADVKSGVDRAIAGPERIEDNFPGATFAIGDGVTSVDSGDLLEPGGDPIRIGVTDLLTFTPVGTATPGSLYVFGRPARQYVVRVLGVTGRTRVLEFHFPSRQWLTR